MKTIAIAALVLLAAVPASADHIGLFNDPVSLICLSPVPVPVSTVSLWVMHLYSPGATGSQWRISNSLSGLLPMGSSCISSPLIGDPFTGASYGYGECLTGTITVCRLDFIWIPVAPVTGCNQLRVEPYPGDTDIQVADCASGARSASGGYFSFENIPGLTCDDCAVGVETTTWGAVKALYR